jgi:hypothetical protein
VVGTWAVVDCPLELDGRADVTGLGLGCSFGETTSGHLQVSGSLTLDDMGNFEDNTTTRGEHVFELPETCLQTNVAFCKDIAKALHVTGYATATCIDNTETGGCTCSGTFDRQGGLAVISHIESVRGQYTASDDSLVTSDNGYKVSYDYCATDNALVLTLPMATRVGDVEGSIVLQRQ